MKTLAYILVICLIIIAGCGGCGGYKMMPNDVIVYQDSMSIGYGDYSDSVEIVKDGNRSPASVMVDETPEPRPIISAPPPTPTPKCNSVR